MKFKITIKGITKEVEVKPIEKNILKIILDGKEYEVEVSGIEEKISNFKEELPELGFGEIAYEEFVVKKEEVIDVRSPLPGIISAIAVKEGDRVRKGEIMLYIESMKMLNEVIAPRDGIVKEILKNVGDVVNIGDIILRIGE
ncbi:MAG: biotin/lipoyl-containing protein [Candidatus Methanomethylicaceae archaeon]|nr:biotin/lipoyl-binding protein [Candidatus Verstraetearchaeota archaeon]